MSKRLNLQLFNSIYPLINQHYDLRTKISTMLSLLGSDHLEKCLQVSNLPIVKLTNKPTFGTPVDELVSLAEWCNVQYGHNNYAIVNKTIVFNSHEEAVMFKLQLSEWCKT